MAVSTHYVQTPDGWQLALHRIRPPRRARRLPLVMVPGLAANRLNLDLDERYSIARAAAHQGFDVFVLELRGTGLSRPPGGRDRALFSWSFSDFAEHDLPAALRTVRELSGAPLVHAFGHSMGGMLLAHHAAQGEALLRSLALVGTPLVAALEVGGLERAYLKLASRFAASGRRVPLRRAFGAAGRVMRFSVLLADGRLLNAANVDAEVMLRLASEAVEDVPLSLLNDFWGCMLGSGAHAFTYEHHLHRVEAPALVVSGAVDRIAPPAAVEALALRLRGQDVRYREAGVRQGFRVDYGHADLLVGRRAPEEIYPLLLQYWREMDDSAHTSLARAAGQC